MLVGSVYLNSIFPIAEDTGELYRLAKSISVKGISINKASRDMKIVLDFGTDIPRNSIVSIENHFCKMYGLNSVNIEPKCCYSDEYMQNLSKNAVDIFPHLTGFLAGAQWDIKERNVTVSMRCGVSEISDMVRVCLAKKVYQETGEHIAVQLKECSAEEMAKADKEYEELKQQCYQSKSDDIAPWEDKKPEHKTAAPEKPKAQQQNRQYTRKPAAKAIKAENEDDIIMGKPTEEQITKIGDVSMESGFVTVRGEIFFTDVRDIPAKNLKVIIFEMTDYSGSIRISRVMDSEKAQPILDKIKVGLYVQVQGTAGFSKFEHDTIITPTTIIKMKKAVKKDNAAEKRVELHLHTNMSTMDGMTPATEYIKRASEWGHKAIAITDHGVAQAFPEAMNAGKKYGVKIIYGVEGYLINDVSEFEAVKGKGESKIDDEIVVFDLETTGLNVETEAITEIAAVVIKSGELCERFHSYVNPKKPIPPNITELTGISDETVKDAPDISEALPKFLEFIAGRPVAAHNAKFDMGFVNHFCKKCGIEQQNLTVIDTLPLSRALLPHLKKHKLNIVAEELKVGDFEHHRADEDTDTLAKILIKLIEKLKSEHGIKNIQDINVVLAENKSEKQNLKSYHIILLVKNQVGLRNLYKLISDSHLKYFKKRPRIPKSLLSNYRDGIIVGSACEAGELFRAMLEGASDSDLENIASFYDFLEIQPIGNNEFLVREGRVENDDGLRNLNRRIADLADKLEKPIVATGDVHFLNPQDEVFRRVLMAGQGFSDADFQPPLYFKTTDEMLEEFSYLGVEKAYQAVVDNPNKIAELCEPITPIPISDKPFSPELPGSKDELVSMCYAKAKRLYGDPLPEIVKNRLEKELIPITKYGFDVMYMIAQKLVGKSLEAGYLVGSRGSVGSSLVAYMSDITEVNALPPHYRCGNCKYSKFFTDAEYTDGPDMDDAVCPNCGEKLIKDGFDIPFETFLGFDGDKAPDIDLNFSGKYQATAHRNTVELFGEDHVFKAGTIGSVAEKTAYGYVKKYMDERGIIAGKAEINRLTVGCTGVKRTTGQHPGGLIVVPKNLSILQFCPVQHPADDPNSDIITTHFDYHSIHDLLLKLDLLAHDSPTVIRMLEDLTDVTATKIPLDDKDTMSIFTSSKVLGYENDDLLGVTGAAAIPEFGTKFAREMLIDTHPTQFDELVRLSGLSHGTDVWLGNAQDLIKSGTATLSQAICCRDDIMLYLIHKKLDPKQSFFIMESVRKGKGLKPEWEDEMRSHDVPEWYINSCKKIKYMFPKAHAVAYVMLAFRIAWFKVHRPLAFYCAYFTGKISAFDLQTALKGKEFIKSKIKAISDNPESTAVDKETAVILEICYEFLLRGLKFANIDIYKSHPTDFVMEGEDTLRPPLTALAGLGETAALSIAEERKKGEFLSMDEIVLRCAKVSKTTCEKLKELGAMGDLPDSSQCSLF